MCLSLIANCNDEIVVSHKQCEKEKYPQNFWLMHQSTNIIFCSRGGKIRLIKLMKKSERSKQNLFSDFSFLFVSKILYNAMNHWNKICFDYRKPNWQQSNIAIIFKSGQDRESSNANFSRTE